MLDQRGGAHDQRAPDLRRRYAVIDALDGFLDHQVCGDVVQPLRRPGHRLLQLAGLEEGRPTFGCRPRQPSPAGRLRRLEAACLPLLVMIGAVKDVGLGGVVALLPHEVLLDDVLDVLDVGIELREAGVDLIDDGIDQAGECAGRGAVTGCLQRPGDGEFDALAFEPDYVPGSLDDLGRGHDVGDSWRWAPERGLDGRGDLDYILYADRQSTSTYRAESHH